VFGEVTGQIDSWLGKNVLPGPIAKSVSSYVSQFAAAAARLTALGIAFLAVTAVMLMLTIDRALNRIFRVSRPRPLVQQLLMYWAVLTLGPVLIGASISMTSYVVSASLGLTKGLPFVGEVLLRVMPVLFTASAITLVYLIVPNRRVKLRHALIGGFLAGIAFELMQHGFAYYITRFPTYRLVYGAFAAIPIFLVWLYVSWVVVLFGATLTAMIPGYRVVAERRGRPAGQQFHEALELLARLAGAQRAGCVLPVSLIAAETRLSPDQCERLLERMEHRGWVARAAGEGWLLARDARQLQLEEIFKAFVIEVMPAEAQLRMTLAEAAAR
jgi:membrane protein